jgi:hypothetical protein
VFWGPVRCCHLCLGGDTSVQFLAEWRVVSFIAVFAEDDQEFFVPSLGIPKVINFGQPEAASAERDHDVVAFHTNAVHVQGGHVSGFRVNRFQQSGRQPLDAFGQTKLELSAMSVMRASRGGKHGPWLGVYHDIVWQERLLWWQMPCGIWKCIISCRKSQVSRPFYLAHLWYNSVAIHNILWPERNKKTQTIADFAGPS